MAKNLRVEVVGDTKSYSKALGDASNATSSFGSTLAKTAKVAALAFGAAGVGAAIVTLKRGFDEIAESQQVMAQTNAVLKSTGDIANVTAKQVESMAGSLSALSGADDEAIQAGENMLLTFTNIRNEAGKNNDIFNQASKTLTDFAFAMNKGAAPSAEQLAKNAILLGKALNDPIKGVGALSRVGVTFTAGQKKQIKALVDSGHAMEAQKLILRELNKEFGGSAEAAGKTLPGQLNKLKNNFDDLAGELTSHLLPAVNGALSFLNNFVTKLSGAKGFKAKIGVVFEPATDAFNAVRKALSDLLFGGVSKGGGVGPEGIKIDPGIISKFTAAFAALDWTEVGQSIVDGITNALKTAGDFAKTFASTVVDGIRSVNWEEVGRVIGPGLATAIAVAFKTLTDPAFWARNWDLALAVLIAAFPVGKIAGPIGKLLAKPFADGLLAVTAIIERFSPRLGEAVLVGLRALPGKVAQLLGALTGPVGALFGKLGALAVFTVKVLGIEAALAAVTQFAKDVGGFFARVGRDIVAAFATAWEDLKRGAIAAALAIVEPFSHLPGFLGGWARNAKDALQGELDKIDAARTVRKMRSEFDSQVHTFKEAGSNYAAAVGAGLDVLIANGRVVGQKASAAVKAGFSAGSDAFAAGVALGNSLMTGVDAGIRAKINLVIGTANSVIAQINATMRTAAQAKSPSKLTALLGKDLIDGMTQEMIKTLDRFLTTFGPTFTKGIVGLFTKAGTEAKTAGVKGMGTAAAAIVAAAKKAGVDARAALAVAMTEGGTNLHGPAGDSGTSFGPFQLHIGGANPFGDPKKAREFAESIQGITYAINQMAKAGAAGKTGFDAIRAIVTSFERPANPAAEIAKAIGFYKQIPEAVGGALTAAGAKTSASIVQTLQGFLALVKQYGPTIGKEQVTTILAGIDANSGNLVAKGKEAILKFIAAAKAQIATSKKDLKDAFAGLATDALSAFDEANSNFVSPSAKKLAKMQVEDQINASVKAVADAQTAIDNAVAKLQADQASGADAATLAEDQAAIDAGVQQLGEAQRAATELQLQLNADQEQKAHDKQVAADREHLTERLIVLQTELAKHPEEYAKIQRQILKLLKGYIPGFNSAGYKLTHAFADGLNDGIAEVVAKARALATALEAVTGGGTRAPTGNPAGPQRPPDVPGGSRFATGAGTVVNVTVQGDVTGEEVVKKVRDGLRTMAVNNALDPLAGRA